MAFKEPSLALKICAITGAIIGVVASNYFGWPSLPPPYGILVAIVVVAVALTVIWWQKRTKN